MAKEGDLRVYWVPQIPGQTFYVPVDTFKEAHLLLETLALYDAFQYANNIKPDYCNAGGLEVYNGDEWLEWEDFETYRKRKFAEIFSGTFQKKLWDCVKLMDTRKGQ